MINNTFIAVYENAASDDLCDRIIQSWENLNKTVSAYRGAETNRGYENRQDLALPFNQYEHDLTCEINGLLDQYLYKYTEQYPSVGMLPMFSYEVKVQKTKPKGGFHKWHCEHAVDDKGSRHRVLTWSIYLNDLPDGEGETEFIEFGLRIPARKGTLVLFPAAWTHTHRGNPPVSKDKYIATGWYYREM